MNTVAISADVFVAPVTPSAVDCVTPTPFEQSDEAANTFETPVYANETYKFENGHWVGADGFIVPNCFSEFYAEFPNFVYRFCTLRMQRCDQAEVEDRVHDLLMHLMTIPENSTFLAPGTNNYPDGCKDRVMTFSPVRSYGASKARFLHYINQVLTNAFTTCYNRSKKNALDMPGNLSYQETTEGFIPDVIDDHYLTRESRYYLKAIEEGLIRLKNGVIRDDIRLYIMEHNPDLLVMWDELPKYSSYTEMMADLNMDETTFVRARHRLAKLVECYNLGTAPPKQRRLYRPRASKLAKIAAAQAAAEAAANSVEVTYA
jgi:hypothetical protein